MQYEKGMGRSAASLDGNVSEQFPFVARRVAVLGKRDEVRHLFVATTYGVFCLRVKERGRGSRATRKRGGGGPIPRFSLLHFMKGILGWASGEHNYDT